MATELLVLRCGERYLRLRDEGYELCSMSKASVFPLNELAQVKKTLAHLATQGAHDLRLHKLTITEEPFEEV